MYPVGDCDLESCLAEQIADLHQIRRLATRWLADDQPHAHHMPDQAGLRRGATGMDDAANHPLDRDHGCDDPARVDRFQLQSLRSTFELVEKPPGHAVHRHQQLCSRPEQSLDRRRQSCQGRSLDSDDDQVLRTQIQGRVAGDNRHLAALPCAVHALPMLAQSGQGRAARQRAQVNFRQAAQMGGKPAANGAGTNNANFHRQNLLARVCHKLP